jgi:hypothetical protein
MNLALVSGSSQARELLATVPAVANESFCTVSAGWQEFEGEFEELGLGIGNAPVDLHLHARAEDMFHHYPALRDAHARRQALVQDAERYYQLRLGFAMDAALALWEEEGESPLLHQNRLEAVRVLRSLDRQHLRRLQLLYEAFVAQLDGETASAVARERGAIAHELARCSTVLLCGGHVTVLLNRLRLFELGPLLATRQVVAWGAGAMVCAGRVVLFHDHGPLGPRHPAFLDQGLGLAPSVVVLPGARRRLALAQRQRMGLLSRRVAPAQALLLEGDAQVLVEDGKVRGGRSLHRLSASGRVVKVRAS